MAQKTIDCSLRGVSPLMMHKFPMIPIPGIDKKPPKEQAEYAAYRDDGTDSTDESTTSGKHTGELFIPGENIYRALVSGATYSKGKGRMTLQKFVAACVMVYPSKILLGTKTFIVDSRRVVIKATGGSIIRHRPRLDDWGINFQISYDDTLLSEEQLRKVVDDTGMLVGFLEYRPEKKGPYGRFMVTEWKEKKD